MLMPRARKRHWKLHPAHIALLSFMLLIVALPTLYCWDQVQYSKTARNHVESLLRDRSSTLSRSLANRVGPYDSAAIEGAYAHFHWHKAIVDGIVTRGHERHSFRIIDKNGAAKIESTLKLK